MMKKSKLTKWAIVVLFAAPCLATAQTSLLPVQNYSWQITQAPREFNGKLQIGFVSGGQGFPNYGTVLTGGGYNNTQDGGAFQLYFPYSNLYGGNVPRIRLGSYNNVGWSDWQVLYTGANANHETADWTARKMYVVDRLGIGTNDPKEALSVNGKILAQEIKVKTDISVPDYVFDPEYKLPTLASVEYYVKKHRHLPEIPSAATIQKEGVNLTEMNFALLKKIEELTLHLIEKDKKIVQQEKTLEAVLERLEKLERK
ncbi:hypothetical protein K7A41_07745 [Sphingobacterium sp. InxBP1]|uniref:hypothetical protein n=1 Tax=Sphingobacterium sp. InxBP1 TaxID=2870328 RepID=UPI00224410D5|nr:hypothetical protein [Sphingobacterium sp. InxBP1]MCW8311111.1 hypothetical protein [Sphingobacterium sp. InxBP1]